MTADVDGGPIGFVRRLLDSRLARGSLWLTISMFAGLGLQGAYFVILARTLGPGDFGTFGAALAAVSLLVPFTTWGTGNLLVRDAAVQKHLLGRLRRRALLTTALTSGCFLAVVIGLGWFIAPSSDFLILLSFLGASEFFFARVTEINGQCFQSQDRYALTGVLQILASAVRLAAALTLALVLQDVGLMGWGALYLGSAIAAALASSGLVLLVLDLRIHRGDTPSWPLSTGFFFSLGSASKTAYSDLDKVMLMRISGGFETGIYAAAYRVITIASAPIRALVLGSNTRLFRAAAQDPAATYGIARRLTPAVAVYGGVVGLALFLCAPVVEVLLGSTYHDTIAALRWLALLPLIEGVHYLYGDSLMGMGRQRRRSLFQLGTVLLNVGLNVWMIPSYNWRGAAMATLISESILAIAMVWSLRAAARSSLSSRTLVPR